MLGPLTEAYQQLGLIPGVGVERVRKAFAVAVKVCHPDLTGDADDTEAFIRLRRAYQLILGYEEGRRETASRRQGRPALGLGQDELDIWLSLGLSSQEATRGLKTLIRYQRRQVCPHCRAGCPNCRGLGWLAVEEPGGLRRLSCPACKGGRAWSCPACGGRGLIEAVGEVFVQVPAGVENHSRLVFPGLGHQDRERRGELIVYLKIEV